MKSNGRDVFFVGNAHLDPVWMWRFPEGCAEARHTIRSALDRMNEYPRFRFCCSSASVYEWIEKFDPEMFREIQQRVAQGRFVIVGGWYVQPDCNMPSGEAFARQALYSQRYFFEKFGKTAVVGYNVDSFGHNGNMPQLLRNSGLRYYVFMRPMFHELTLPSPVFRWAGPDGSEVLATRLTGAYNHSEYTSADELTEVVEKTALEMAPWDGAIPIFYGVGNHGGGPTKRNIEAIQEAGARNVAGSYHFSDLTDYFRTLEERKEDLPVWRDELQHHASGCYSAYSPVKMEIRRCESLLFQAEVFSHMADRLLDRAPSDRGRLAEAWKNVLFSDFHDIICGCCIPSAYEDTLDMLGETKAVAKKLINEAVQSISGQIDTGGAEKGCPVVVFNPHPFPVKGEIVVNRQFKSLYTGDGKPVPIQPVTSESAMTTGRTDMLFLADVPSMGYACYYFKQEGCQDLQNGVCRASVLTHSRNPDPFTAEHHHTPTEYLLENSRFRIVFEERSGFMRSFFDKSTQKELLQGYGAVPVVIDEYAHDTWSHKRNCFDREIGCFYDAVFSITEAGPLRSCLKVTTRYGESKLSQYFILREGEDMLEVRCVLDWHEKHKMLKLRYSWDMDSPHGRYEIPFGSIRRPCNGGEECGQRWVLMQDETHGMAMINNGKYSFSMRGNRMDLTCVRSPLFADHGGERHEEALFTDQGMQEFIYCLFPAEENELERVCQRALLLDRPLIHIVENNHGGRLAPAWEGICLSHDNIQVSAVKRSEDDSGYIVRLYETSGKKTRFTMSGPMLPMTLCDEIAPCRVETYYLPDGGRKWQKVLFSEFPVGEDQSVPGCS